MLRYRSPLSGILGQIDRRFRKDGSSLGREGWNTAMSGEFSFYKGGNLFTDLRSAVMTEMLRYHLPKARSALDVGCGTGHLASYLSRIGITRYVGTDISDMAVACGDPSMGTFVAADMREFELPGEGNFDLIIFNEVLYYIGVDEAIEQVDRYVEWLAPDGMICVSMSDDPKAHAITERLARRHRWVDGVLFQDRRMTPKFRTSTLLPRPHLVGILEPGRRAATA